MSIPKVTAADVGTYWTREDGSIWRIIAFTELPTVTWEAVEGPPEPRQYHRARVSGAVGSPITEGFQRLVIEGRA